MDDVMVVILPLLHQRFMQLFAHDDSDQSAFIQKQILKIFHAYTQVCPSSIWSRIEWENRTNYWKTLTRLKNFEEFS